MYRKFVVILASVIMGGLLTGRVYPADIKIGWVDMQRAVNECDAGKEAKKALAKEAEKDQRLIAERQNELKEMKESLEKQVLLLTPEARTTKERELQTKLRDFQRWGEDVQNELNQKRIEMERNISSGLVKVVQEIGTKEGYTVILQRNENIVLFSSGSVDLTDRVIKAYDMEKK
jgi:outer membrane protein